LTEKAHACIIHVMNDSLAKTEVVCTQTDLMGEQGMLVLLGAARRLQERLEAALDGVGLSGAKYQALEQLARAREPLALSELAGCLNCVRSNVTQLVDRLEADGLVRRVADPADRRAIRAELTPLGVDRQVAGAAAVRGVQAELGAKLSPVERETFIRVLSALA
jgi:DNA-binding MarR family transcriptional regulator